MRKVVLVVLVALAGCETSGAGGPALSDTATIVAQHLVNALCAGPPDGLRQILGTPERQKAFALICQATNRNVP